jgi:hypothetical protein
MYFTNTKKAREYLREIGIALFVRMVDTKDVAESLKEWEDKVWAGAYEDGRRDALEGV